MYGSVSNNLYWTIKIRVSLESEITKTDRQATTHAPISLAGLLSVV